MLHPDRYRTDSHQVKAGFPRVAFSNLPRSDFWPTQLQQQKHLELDEDSGLYPQWPISISFTAGLPEASQSYLSPVTSNNGHKTFY